MGCSHSVREEKPHLKPKRSRDKKQGFLAVESIVPIKANKIVLKSITQETTNETRKGSPIFRDLRAPKP